MITQKTILALYRKYSKPPRNFAQLELNHFVETYGELYGIVLDNTHITFEKMEVENPFRSILLRNLCGIVDFEYHVAVITPTYILFFGRTQYSLDVHFKPEQPSLFKRLIAKLAKRSTR